MPSARLTIVQMVPELNGGGVETETLEVSAEIVRQGHRSIVISSGGRLVDQLHNHGAEHVAWNIRSKSPASLRWIWPLRKYLQANHVNIIHARSRIPAWIGYLAWRGMNRETRPRFMTTAHGLYSVNRYSEIMTRGERVIAISETVKNYLECQYPRMNQEAIRFIPRGIDPHDFPRNFQPSSEWLATWFGDYPELHGRPVISLVGRMTRLKGHRDLIEIIDRLRKVSPEVRALVVGDVDPRRARYSEEIHQEIRQKNLQDHFVFTGHRTDVREIYSVSDIVLSLTSDPPEAFGRATVEALSMGVPVVGYDHGGTGEILRHVFPNGLVEPGNIEMAVNQVQKLLRDGIQVPAEHPYLISRMLAETIAVYEELAA